MWLTALFACMAEGKGGVLGVLLLQMTSGLCGGVGRS